MKITSKFIHSGTRKFDWVDCRDRVSSESENWPDVGVGIAFYVGNEELGEIKVKMSNEQADELVLAILTQTVRNRRERIEYEAKQAKKAMV